MLDIGLDAASASYTFTGGGCFNPSCAGYWLRRNQSIDVCINLKFVSILLVLDIGLDEGDAYSMSFIISCFNPSCAGYWLRRKAIYTTYCAVVQVSILLVLDIGLDAGDTIIVLNGSFAFQSFLCWILA